MKLGRTIDKRQSENAVKAKTTSKRRKDSLRTIPMKVGYARVSTDDQKVDLQRHALEKAGCDEIFVDHGISGEKADRAGLQKAINALRPGDMLVVWRLDRLGRSLINLVVLVNSLGTRGIKFRSLTESIDTGSFGGRLVFHLMAALAEFERSLISERTKAGMAAAKLRGKHAGRPRQDKQAKSESIKLRCGV